MRHAILALILCTASITALCQEASTPTSNWITLDTIQVPRKDHGYAWGADGTLDITSEFGLLVGLGPVYTRYAYRAYPYLYKTSFVGAFTIPSWRYKFIYSFFMPSLANRLALELKTGVSTAEVINFYGFGSDTPRDETKEKAGYYNVDATVYSAIFYLGFGITPSLWLGPALDMSYVQMRNMEGRLINELDSVAIGADRLYLGPGLQLHSDARSHWLYPLSGTYFSTAARGWFAPSPGRTPFYQLAADWRWFATLTSLPDVVLALRLRGMATFGQVPFYQIATLGGRQSLRGYEFERFRGDHMVAGSSEIRFPLFQEVIVIPVEFGGFLMGDVGRLWYEGESPGGWRGTWGLGVWGATLSRDVLGILYVAFSREYTSIRAGFGFDY